MGLMINHKFAHMLGHEDVKKSKLAVSVAICSDMSHLTYYQEKKTLILHTVDQFSAIWKHQGSFHS